MPEPRIVRVFPRLCMGGAENAIVQLLEHVGNTHMVVTHIDGMRASDARRLADKYTLLKRPRFLGLLQAMQDADIVHVHTINDHPLIPLVAQLSGAPILLQTVHNQLTPQYCHFMDHAILVGDELLERVATPARSTVIPNGIPCPDAVPPVPPWCAPEADRPLTLIEMRRENKLMRWSLSDLLATGALDDLDLRCQIMGISAPSTDPRLEYLGPIANPYPILAQADFLVMGTETETFGRTVYEAMAWGALPVATPIDAFTRVFSTDQVAYIDGDVQAAALQLRAHIERYRSRPVAYRMRQEANHRFVTENFGIQRMADRTQSVYQQILNATSPAPRSFSPADLAIGDIRLFGELVDDMLESSPPKRLSEVADLPPRMQGILYWLLVASGKAHPDKRIDLLAAARQRLGNRFILNLRLGQHLVHAERLEPAIEALSLAQGCDPTNIDPVLGLAEAWVQLGHPEQALHTVRQARAQGAECTNLCRLETQLQRAILSHPNSDAVDHHVLVGPLIDNLPADLRSGRDRHGIPRPGPGRT